ncbi:MAG: hypothetical protein PHS66_07145 [Candidatus Omnitrophica bacterium]|nr:hypothetical protein [Candidatus Omnitrophota bacterium]
MKKKHFVLMIILAIIVIAAVILIFFRGVLATNLAGKILLKSGKPMQFGEYTVLVDKVEANKLYGIKVTGKDKKLTAESGDYTYLPEQNAIKFNLVNGAADNYDPENPGAYQALAFKQSRFTIKLRHSD